MVKYLLLFTFLSSLLVFPQNNMEHQFKMALEYLNSYQYENALKEFSDIADDENNVNYTAAVFFKGKLQFMLNAPDDALKTYSILFNNYPSSRYIDEARIVTANYFLQSGKYSEAMNQFCLIVKNSSSQEYLNAAKVSGKKLAQLYLLSSELDSLLIKYMGSKAEPYLYFCYAGALSSNGNISEADSLYNFIVKTFPGSDESKDALLNRKANTDQQNLIAVILPLSKDGNEDGSAAEILEGIKFAVDESNENAVYKTGIIIKDTERDSVKINSFRDLLIKQQNIKAVLGPVYSDEVKNALDAFKNLKITLLSPTATENDLAKKYPWFLQANSSFAYRGKIVAQYIYYVENKRKMAVLSPSAGYAYQLAMAFKTEFKKLGGKIIADEVYKSGSFDLSQQAANIAAKKNNIEGIYTPLADKSDAAVILAQLDNSGIDINLYGNQDWFNAKGIQSSVNLSNKLVLSSDYFIDYNDPAYIDLNKRFKEKTGMEADRNVLYGYDAAKCLLSVLDGSSTRESVLEKLDSGIVFNGFHNNISFDSERMNKVLNIIRYRDGVYELVDRFKAGE